MGRRRNIESEFDDPEELDEDEFEDEDEEELDEDLDDDDDDDEEYEEEYDEDLDVDEDDEEEEDDMDEDGDNVDDYGYDDEPRIVVQGDRSIEFRVLPESDANLPDSIVVPGRNILIAPSLLADRPIYAELSRLDLRIELVEADPDEEEDSSD